MFTVPSSALKIISILKNSGFDAVIAGGWVRDSILNIESNDIDIATNATPSQINLLFGNVKFVGEKFGVSLVAMDGIEYEIATFRKDGIYSDNRHPDSVEFCNMEEDAKRRDLTMNALFYNPIEYKIYDFVGGLDDIKNKIAKFVGNPIERITEDYIRMLRIIRFANRFNFSIDTISRYALCNNSRNLANCSKERLALEMNKILVQCNSKAIVDLKNYLFLLHIVPELYETIGCKQPPEFHPEGDVWTHTLLAFDYMKTLEPNLECLWAILLHDIGKPKTALYDQSKQRWRFNGHDVEGAEIAKTILKRLKYSCKFQDNVSELILNHMKFANVKKMKNAKIKRFIFMPNFKDHCKIHQADCLSSRQDFGNIKFLEDKLKEFSTEQIMTGLPKPIITGKNLIDIGLKPGPQFKEILEKCMDMQLENPNIKVYELYEFIKLYY